MKDSIPYDLVCPFCKEHRLGALFHVLELPLKPDRKIVGHLSCCKQAKRVEWVAACLWSHEIDRLKEKYPDIELESEKVDMGKPDPPNLHHMSGKPVAQRQDSLIDQLRDLIMTANRLGMYDAADYLVGVVQQSEKKEKD
jgi:hypothetical protein